MFKKKFKHLKITYKFYLKLIKIFYNIIFIFNFVLYIYNIILIFNFVLYILKYNIYNYKNKKNNGKLIINPQY